MDAKKLLDQAAALARDKGRDAAERVVRRASDEALRRGLIDRPADMGQAADGARALARKGRQSVCDAIRDSRALWDTLRRPPDNDS